MRLDQQHSPYRPGKGNGERKFGAGKSRLNFTGHLDLGKGKITRWFFLFLFFRSTFNISMRFGSRRKSSIFFLVLGICLVALAIALYVGWILLSLEQIVFLVLGIIFFALIITGLVLNTLFLIREIRRNEQHNAFLNAVTHELKTPIASIRLYLETLRSREVTPEKQQEFYGIMLADSDRLLNTVEQILQASRAREQKRRSAFSPIELVSLLTQSIERIKTRYNLDPSAIAFNPPSHEITISGNAPELETVFTNLLDNAVKYAGNEVKILVSVKDSDEKTVEIRFKDFGIGVARPELKRIFKRFYRGESADTQKTKGTGLGLFIAGSVIAKHGGKIWAESKGDERGSRFIVRLPKTAARKI
jgi:signal transduction histidine kinase